MASKNKVKPTTETTQTTATVAEPIFLGRIDLPPKMKKCKWPLDAADTYDTETWPAIGTSIFIPGIKPAAISSAKKRVETKMKRAFEVRPWVHDGVQGIIVQRVEYVEPQQS